MGHDDREPAAPNAIDDADTDETILTVDEDDALVELDEAEVREIISTDKTGSTRVCTECGRSVYVLAASPPPQVEDLVTSTLFWEPKGADGESEACTVSGDADGPIWWFCAAGRKERPPVGWFVVRGLFRAQIVRL